MIIVWAFAAWADADRLHSFMAQSDLTQADALLDRLTTAPAMLLDFPRRGAPLSEFGPREVRELRSGRHVVRYELTASEIRILRLFHVREDRQ